MKPNRLVEHLNERAQSDSEVRKLRNLIDEVCKDCLSLTKAVLVHFPEYTLHDEVHINKILGIMDHLIPQEILSNLAPLELAGLVLAGILHDVGMAPSQDEVDCLIGRRECEDHVASRQDYESLLIEDPQLRSTIQALGSDGRWGESLALQRPFLSDFLRRTHCQRGRKFIRDKYGDLFVYGSYRFANDLASVCFSHNEPPTALKSIDCRKVVRGPDEWCNWRFVAIILRLADILDFDHERTPGILLNHLNVRDETSIREWKRHLSVAAVGIRPGEIAVTAECPDPYTHHAILTHIKAVETELEAARNLISEMFHRNKPDLGTLYKLPLPDRVNIEAIQAQKDLQGKPIYIYRDISFQLDHERIIDLVMGVTLYADKSLFLRELLQNGVDACRHRAEIHRSDPTLARYVPEITVRFTESGGKEFIEVEDNGMGMDERIITEYFSRVGRSYYTSREFRRDQYELGMGFRPISHFGLGFLSVFMVSNQVEVETRRFGPNVQSLAIGISGTTGLFWLRGGQRAEPGTLVRVELQVPSHEFLNTESAEEFLKFRSTEEFRNLPAKDRCRSPRTSLISTVRDLAPHVEFAIRVQEERGESSVQSIWTFHNGPMKYSEIIEVALDLTSEAQTGLEGQARVYLLRQSGQFRIRIDLDDSDREPGRDPRTNFVEHRYASIVEFKEFHNSRGDQEVRESRELVHSLGRWSQQGFLVPTPLIPRERAWWLLANRRHYHVPFPFPIDYDLNLSDPLVLPLSTDRTRIVPLPDAEKTCRTIGKTLAMLLFDKIGRSTICDNMDFFQEIAKLDQTDRSPFREALEEFMGLRVGDLI